MDPSVAGWIERQKQLDIASGLVPDPNGPFVLRGPDGKPFVPGQSSQSPGGGQQKLAILAYGTNEWGMSRSYIKSKTKDLIQKLMDKGYKVVVIPPSSGLVVFANPKGHVTVQDPHFGVIKAAEEMKAKLEYGQYSENDPLGKYVHLHPRYAKNVKAKYKPDIVVGDSNAALINGGQSVTAKDGASYTTVSDMIGGLSKQSTQPTQPRTSNNGPTRVMGDPTLSSQYGEMRGSQMHGGTDIAANPGAPLVPVTDATIVDYGKLSLTGAKRGDPSGWGNFIVYKDSQGYYHLYGHILESGMKTSGSVKKGVPIAKVGSTGKSSGPHLHWEMGTSWSGGTLGGKMDPLSVYKVNDPFTVGGEMSDNSETREVTPAVTAPPSNNKPLTVPMDQIPGENAPQAEIDEYFRKLEAGELTGSQPSSQAQVSPTTPPALQSSSVESQAPYEQNGGGSVVVMAPPAPAQSGGGGRSKGGMVMAGSGDVLNSYYKAQLLGFLYKFG
jgi:murein DD-endopeptidase MepM/ murein hydrolase activator NlpD